MEVDDCQGIEEQQIEKEAEQNFQEEERELEGISIDDDFEIYAQNDQSAQDITDKSDSDNDNLKEENLKEFLSNWSVQYNISHIALRLLLRKLKQYSVHANLPLNPPVIITYSENYRNKNCFSRKIFPLGPVKGNRIYYKAR
ncbi:PREDICTED: uncharacterized protein LOC105144032 [Acromyrmex echinatior]|uniref:uncharacterized protein LOC105144032 n=1 Tax=Acromyrmex echinatior TaxID=103372 RepID=UPI0005810D36|nr:PREDICTED: uncharacterized protein LOC105144032 [Acromyrmex echinatior]